MKLDKIKLSGFKSFADQTIFPLKGNLIALVGPNGCGKSNIIDAVRWVMGESSAKHLRGDNMADVIFNGSASRKPVGIASVELVFDNSSGRCGGEYAKYANIAVARQVNRDGLSRYTLNGLKCRRKDITDIFLGTGLGARGYAIIEQGTISKMVDASPVELRVYIEEAAGVSKYKERRQETCTGMRRTRENIERLDDVRDEVAKRLNNLQKQATLAKKFTSLKQNERQKSQELLAINWREHQQVAATFITALDELSAGVQQLTADLDRTDQDISDKRLAQKQGQGKLDQLQAQNYQVQADIAKLQQTISHADASRIETVQEIERLSQQATSAKKDSEKDQHQLTAIQKSQHLAKKEQTAASEHLAKVQRLHDITQKSQDDWYMLWQQHLQKSAKTQETTQVQNTKLAHCQEQSQQLQSRKAKLHAEKDALAGNCLQSEIAALDLSIAKIKNSRANLGQQIASIQQSVLDNSQKLQDLQNQLQKNHAELHQINGKISSLELLQQHAMDKNPQELAKWLAKMGWAKNRRLAQLLRVEDGWDKAVEIVLADYLAAVCIADADGDYLLEHLAVAQAPAAVLVKTSKGEGDAEPSQLLAKIAAPIDLSGLLGGIYWAASLADAIAKNKTLQGNQSVITADGVWLGKNWLKTAPNRDDHGCVLQRQRDLDELGGRRQTLQSSGEQLQIQINTCEKTLQLSASDAEKLQLQDSVLSSEFADKNAENSAYCAKQQQQQQRLVQISADIEEIASTTNAIAVTQDNAEKLQLAASQDATSLDSEKQTLQNDQQEIIAKQSQNNAQLAKAQERHQIALAEAQSLKVSLDMTAKQIARSQLQNSQAAKRVAYCQDKLRNNSNPLDDEKARLQTWVEQKLALEAQLKVARNNQQAVEQQAQELGLQRQKTEQLLAKQSQELNDSKLQQQESRVRMQTISEQLAQLDVAPEQLLADLPPDAAPQVWEDEVQKLAAKIAKLGAINLTAIEEFEVCSKRLDFLNDQRDDLTGALDTLLQAIGKMDRESKQMFKATFDKINDGLQDKFPKLFGGGKAYLQLNEQDLLTSGVQIIARPPGKRNSSIHLLSGGEKALTAMALVFAIFDLNPAPFCLLDEVDAPLDDANVLRFSKMIEEMAQRVQFLYVSHNKITMEIAKQLTGVTMAEQGVSRLVAVDINEAINMAEN